MCHAVTTVIRWIEYVVVVITKAVIRTVCEVVTFGANVVGWVINFVLSLPIIGVIARYILGAVTWVVSQVIGKVDFILGLIGIRPIKNVRLEVIILRDAESGPLITPEELTPAVDFAAQTYRERARIKLRSNVQTVTNPTPTVALTVDTGVGLFAEDATRAGFYFRTIANQMLFDSAFFRAIRIWDPIVCFVVRGVGDSTTYGCSGGPILDYICIEVAVLNKKGSDYDETTLPHEIGHALGLTHDAILSGESKGDLNNLMFWSSNPTASPPAPRGTNLSSFQVGIIRSSPHASYF